MNHTLFQGDMVSLAPRDPVRDAEIESQWTHDPEYWRLTEMGPARPLSPAQIRKRYEADDKDKSHFIFAIRTREDDRLIGGAGLKWVEWSNQIAFLSIGIASPGDRGRGYGREALALLLNYAFNELNLHRLSALTFEYNERAVRFLERAGFVLEVRRREAIHRAGRHWDVLNLGLLRDEWQGREVNQGQAG